MEQMNKKEILDILDNAKDERGAVPMRLVRQAFDKLPTIQPVATDTNVGDIISRQAAIDALDCINGVEEVLRSLPSAQPEIIQCRNCKFASGDSRICMKFGHSPIGELDFCAWAERRTDETD